MSLLKKMVKEMASAGATGAHSVAGVPGSLFGGGVCDGRKKKRETAGGMIRRIVNLSGGTLVYENLGANAGETDFSSSDVTSKLDAAEKKANAGDDTTAFGMEDDQGNLVKVYVKTDSAEDFEKALASMLAGEDENEDDENSALEIAEVLFKLKDKFEIVDVAWPEIQGDEEEEQEMEGGGEGDLEGGSEGDDLEGGGEGDPESGDPESGDLEGGDLEGGDMGGEDESDAKSALDKVIDMMKADAEAKKAEAEAKTAEAKAKEADAVARASQAKVTQEEQILDMEAHYKDKSDQDKEAKQLAKLAKYQHEKAQSAETTLSMEGEDLDKDPVKYNDGEDDKEITKEELATLILKNLRHN